MSSEPSSSFGTDEPNQTDSDLFLQLQQGQTNTLAILYDRHAGLVYSIALKLLGNSTEAEDLTQDIFLILTRECSYDPKRGSLRTYLAILTRSRALDRLRSRSRKQRRLREQSLNEDAEMSDSPMGEVYQLEQSQEIQQALAQLSTNEQEVLRMAYYQDLSQSEIAEQLNIALGTVKSRSRRGLLKLRQALASIRGQS
ncbi:MAG: sigma-70 family RNA polymerase sigma factor [Cyanobacteria bacterium P01_G01_bin.39]